MMSEAVAVRLVRVNASAVKVRAIFMNALVSVGKIKVNIQANAIVHPQSPGR
jgi:hypothetical protein